MIPIQLNNYNALVCGASKGIGKACTLKLAQAGAHITALARNEADLAELIAHLPKNHHLQHQFIIADMADSIHFEKRIQALAMDRDIHILVNNTGGPPAGPAHSAKAEQFEEAFRQHLISNHILVSTLLPGMKEKKYGRIINIISTSVKQPLDNLGVSNTIRGAVANWAKTLANELAEFGITVNNVLPGATMTERLESIIDSESNSKGISKQEVVAKMLSAIPAKRFASPDEVASAVCFLARPMASYITGINLPVDGGRTKSL